MSVQAEKKVESAERHNADRLRDMEAVVEEKTSDVKHTSSGLDTINLNRKAHNTNIIPEQCG